LAWFASHLPVDLRQTWQGHACEKRSRRCRLPSGRPRFLAGRCPDATGL